MCYLIEEELNKTEMFLSKNVQQSIKKIMKYYFFIYRWLHDLLILFAVRLKSVLIIGGAENVGSTALEFREPHTLQTGNLASDSNP